MPGVGVTASTGEGVAGGVVAVGVMAGGDGVGVGAGGVSVGATTVFVGASGVFVGGTGVFVGAGGVFVGGTGVFVGGTGVSVGAGVGVVSGVRVGVTDGRSVGGARTRKGCDASPRLAEVAAGGRTTKPARTMVGMVIRTSRRRKFIGEKGEQDKGPLPVPEESTLEGE